MTQQRLELVLDDVVDGQPVSPSSMPVGLLNQFHDQVARFLKGAHPDIDLDTLRVSIEPGSYKLVLPAMALVSGLASDLALLRSGNVDDMDVKRAAVIEEWQKTAQRVKTRRYAVHADSAKPVNIHAGSHFERHDNAMWATVEKYIHGQVVDLGGKKPNLHLQLADGTMLKVNTSQDQVLHEKKNLVYRTALLRVRAEEDVATGKLRHVHLIEFVSYTPAFDAQSFEAMVAKGRKAWADVPDASQWVEEQRGAA
ncbi:MAG: hypothetical protein M0P19_09500 [Nevskia sp.]|jgi:hypothetical protein|nr:hypothetical protein [Nevskia sp.]MCK9384958.1 hypothetical protein [Nevskia sp.]